MFSACSLSGRAVTETSGRRPPSLPTSTTSHCCGRWCTWLQLETLTCRSSPLLPCRAPKRSADFTWSTYAPATHSRNHGLVLCCINWPGTSAYHPHQASNAVLRWAVRLMWVPCCQASLDNTCRRLRSHSCTWPSRRPPHMLRLCVPTNWRPSCLANSHLWSQSYLLKLLICEFYSSPKCLIIIFETMMYDDLSYFVIVTMS